MGRNACRLPRYDVHNGATRRLRRRPWVCGQSYFFYAIRMSFLFSLFLFPSSSFLSSSSSPLPFSHFLHLDLNSPIPVPSQPPTHTSSKPLSATLAASSQHTHSPPPRSSAQKLTILGGCSCLCLIPHWSCLCLRSILIRERACLFVCFYPLFHVMVEVLVQILPI